jgi:hypothetical protein
MIEKINKISRYFGVVLLIAFTINLTSSALFGWNMKPINETEEMFDRISTFGYILGFILWTIHSNKTYR